MELFWNITGLVVCIIALIWLISAMMWMSTLAPYLRAGVIVHLSVDRFARYTLKVPGGLQVLSVLAGTKLRTEVLDGQRVLRRQKSGLDVTVTQRKL